MPKFVDYVHLRLATEVGRRDTIRWMWAALFAVVTAATMVFLVVSRTAAVTVDQYLEAWEAVRSGRVDYAIFPPLVTAAAIMFLPSFAWSVKTICLYRPWRPHSGGAHIALPEPGKLRIRQPSEVLMDEIRQNIVLNENAPRPLRAVNVQAVTATDGGEADGGADDGWAKPLPLQAILPKGMQLFPLYSLLEGMSSERYNVIAFLLHNGGRVNAGEVAERFHMAAQYDMRKATRAVAERFRKASQDGWVEADGRAPGFWVVTDRVVTDLDLLADAVEKKPDEVLAASVAATVGPPLPLLEEGNVQHTWAFKKMGKKSIADNMIVRASHLLDTATENWKNNPTFPAAVDQIYEPRPNTYTPSA